MPPSAERIAAGPGHRGWSACRRRKGALLAAQPLLAPLLQRDSTGLVSWSSVFCRSKRVPLRMKDTQHAFESLSPPMLHHLVTLRYTTENEEALGTFVTPWECKTIAGGWRPRTAEDAAAGKKGPGMGGNMVRIMDKVNGTTCHQCRQKARAQSPLPQTTVLGAGAGRPRWCHPARHLRLSLHSLPSASFCAIHHCTLSYPYPYPYLPLPLPLPMCRPWAPTPSAPSAANTRASSAGTASGSGTARTWTRCGFFLILSALHPVPTTVHPSSSESFVSHPIFENHPTPPHPTPPHPTLAGAGQPGVGVPRLPRHLQLLLEQLPARPARLGRDGRTLPGGEAEGLRERRALHHPHQEARGSDWI